MKVNNEQRLIVKFSSACSLNMFGVSIVYLIHNTGVYDSSCAWVNFFLETNDGSQKKIFAANFGHTHCHYPYNTLEWVKFCMHFYTTMYKRRFFKSISINRYFRHAPSQSYFILQRKFHLPRSNSNDYASFIFRRE